MRHQEVVLERLFFGSVSWGNVDTFAQRVLVVSALAEKVGVLHLVARTTFFKLSGVISGCYQLLSYARLLDAFSGPLRCCTPRDTSG